jgi:hypothetical protein
MGTTRRTLSLTTGAAAAAVAFASAAWACVPGHDHSDGTPHPVAPEAVTPAPAAPVPLTPAPMANPWPVQPTPASASSGDGSGSSAGLWVLGGALVAAGAAGATVAARRRPKVAAPVGTR